MTEPTDITGKIIGKKMEEGTYTATELLNDIAKEDYDGVVVVGVKDGHIISSATGMPMHACLGLVEVGKAQLLDFYKEHMRVSD